jgi:hypothetical protein
MRVDNEAERTRRHLPQQLDDSAPARENLRDMRDVLTKMAPLLAGCAKGNAFHSVHSNQARYSTGVASLLVARCSREGETIWNLCTDPTMQALPMAALAMKRNYVCLAASDHNYPRMVDAMENITFLLDDCRLLFDGFWEYDEGAYHAPAVHLCSPICVHVQNLPVLPCIHRATHTLTHRPCVHCPWRRWEMTSTMCHPSTSSG